MSVPIPQAIPDGHFRVTDYNFSIRTLVEYDPAWMEDQVVMDVFVNGQPAGPYAAMGGSDDMEPSDLIDLAEEHLKRGLIDRHLGLGFQKDVDTLDRQVRDLKVLLALARRPWWRKALDRVKAARR